MPDLSDPIDQTRMVIMRTTTVTDAKARLSAYLRLVERGETITILHRGKPIALLSPAPGGSEPWGRRLARLAAEGVVRRARRRPDWSALLSPSPVRALDPEHGALESLLEEREQGR
jgi:prevent-host-death family protein